AKVGFIAPGGTFTAITAQCAADSQDAGNAVERDCFIVVGDDIVIWTKHFTTFAAYTQVLASSGADQEFPFVPLTAALAAAGIGLVVLGRRREASAAGSGGQHTPPRGPLRQVAGPSCCARAP